MIGPLTNMCLIAAFTSQLGAGLPVYEQDLPIVCHDLLRAGPQSRQPFEHGLLRQDLRLLLPGLAG